MKQALPQLLSDFLSAILFLVVYAVSGDLFAAAAIAVAQLAPHLASGAAGRAYAGMSLGFVVVLSGATMLTRARVS